MWVNYVYYILHFVVEINNKNCLNWKIINSKDISDTMFGILIGCVFYGME